MWLMKLISPVPAHCTPMIPSSLFTLTAKIRWKMSCSRPSMRAGEHLWTLFMADLYYNFIYTDDTRIFQHSFVSLMFPLFLVHLAQSVTSPDISAFTDVMQSANVAQRVWSITLNQSNTSQTDGSQSYQPGLCRWAFARQPWGNVYQQEESLRYLRGWCWHWIIDDVDF